MKLMTWLAAMAVVGCASAASAESFTTTWTSDAPMVVRAPGTIGGAPAVAAYFTGVTTATYKSGAVVKANYQCVQWPAAGMGTNTQAICQVQENATDKYSVVYSCSSDDKSAACWGGLAGTGGKYMGKRGTVSQIGTGASGAGQGAWAD